MSVVGGDGKVAGTISDAWVDRSEYLLRYYEVTLADGGRKVLLPVPFTVIDGDARTATSSRSSPSISPGFPPRSHRTRSPGSRKTRSPATTAAERSMRAGPVPSR